MRSKIANVKSGKQERIIKMFALCVLMFTVYGSQFTVAVTFAAEPLTVEVKLTDFIRKFYGEREDIYIKINLPGSLKDNLKVKHINFVKIPDSNGDGLCLVEVDEKNGRTKNIYVSFKVSKKKKIFVLKQNAKRGDIVHSDDVFIKEVYTNGNGGDYPLRMEDVLGKALKRDLQTGTVITCQVLEDSFVVQKGDNVNIVAENRKLIVQSKGRTLERGKMGDVIRVKNLTSDKEIVGRVVGGSTVKVDL